MAGGAGTRGQIDSFIDVGYGGIVGVDMADGAAVDAISSQCWPISRIKVGVVAVSSDDPTGGGKRGMATTAGTAGLTCP